MPKVTLYHNPRCSKSRQTLQLLKDQGIEPSVVLYLETPPDHKTLTALLKKLGMSARQLMRKGETCYKENNLKDESLTDRQLIDAMVANPILIERPIAVAGSKAALGRPPENVLEIL